MIENNTFDSITQQSDVPIDQKAKGKTCQLQVGYQLGLMQWQGRFNNLIFDKNQAVYSHVQPVADINFQAIRFQRQGYFTFHSASTLAQVMRKASLVG